MSAQRTSPHPDLIERNIAAAFSLIEAQIENPEPLAASPHEATVSLLPDDDPDLARFDRELGPRAPNEGRDVYFRHVRSALPATT